MSSEELTATEVAEMAESDGDKVVTMMDVLQEQEEFEEDANAVLGASDEKNCTYPKGYIKRQALYACLTCCPDAKTDPTKRAGVCLACSLSCHENHELVELYTKRNFCCDCGNSKFNSHPCQFTPNKPELNENNSYNQNFSGIYCICHRPYPDPEASFEDEMIQCIVCEDWLHASHLEAKVPPNEQYSEMICKGCMEKNEFLYDYSDFAVNDEGEDVDVTSLNEKVNGACNGHSKLHEQDKGSGDVEIDDISEKDSEDPKNNTNITLNSTVESSEKTELKPEDETNAMTGIEEKQSDEITTPAEQHNDLEKVTDTLENDKNSTGNESGITEKESNDSPTKENAAGDTAPSSNMETEENKAENENKKTDEQTSSITDGNTTSEEKIEEGKVAPEAATNEPIQNSQDQPEIESKDVNNATSQSESQSAKIEQSEANIEKDDDLMESIDRLINGDDESSKEKVELSYSSDQGKMEENADESNKSLNEETPVNNENVVENEENKDVNAVKSDENQSQTDIEMKETITSEDSTKTNDTDIEPSNDHKRKLDDEVIDKTDVKKAKLDISDCRRPRGVKRRHKGATFWPCNFREKLCTCNECIIMYRDLSLLFLIDLEDTVSAYETLGKEKNDGRSSQYEIGLQALSSLGRIQQINALTEYNKMRDKLLDFLKSFKDRKEVVKEEDIRAFFAGMKPKREPDGVYFCR
ncbi:putative E3 ubiquitin-protein ligase UBR7 [Amyelois transitella]|uniref:putative E3 ubiquitin-protein ligase UBR7 n=1 Tax=Amyelois transitella TaxID=680683 RepID=UPI00298F884A|nr:putative E3 ubiquitin-protein ligase UBR7 [Amyelois transitella]